MTRRRRSFPREIFLSHSSKDVGFATHVADLLRQHGLPIWYSPTEIVGAQQWHDEIGAALSRCDWFIVVLSPAAVESQWVKRELLFALNHPRYVNHIVPVLYRVCKPDRLSWALSGFQFIDFTADLLTASRNLLRVWGKGLRKP